MQFLGKSKSQEEIEGYLRKYGLLDEVQKKPEFEDVLNNIDYLIENAPVALRHQAQKELTEEERKRFNPDFITQQTSERDLLWMNYEKNFIKIFPKGIYGDLEKKLSQKGLQEQAQVESNETIISQL